MLYPVVMQYGNTALLLAVRYNRDAMVTALLEHKANPDLRDKVPQA